MIDVKLWETLSKLESDIIKRKCFRHNESEREAILSAANLLPLMIEICDNNKFEDNNHRIAYLTSAANNRLTEYLAEQYKRESFETTEDNPYERAECSTANAEDLLFTKIEGVSSSAEEKLKERVKNYQPGDSYIDIIVKLGKTPKTVDFIKEALLQGKETKKEIVAFLDAEFPDHKYKKSNVSALASKIRRDEGLDGQHQYYSQRKADSILKDSPHCGFKHFTSLMKNYHLTPGRIKEIFSIAKKNAKKKRD